jgi:hypothetical protein
MPRLAPKDVLCFVFGHALRRHEDNACSDLRLSVGGVLEWLARLLTVSRSSSGCDGAWPVAWVANGPGNRGGRTMRAQRLLEERSEHAATAALRAAWICALR